MSHGVEVERLAPGFEIIAATVGCRHAAVQCLEMCIRDRSFSLLPNPVRSGIIYFVKD